jgi:hypothetical protein
MEAQVSDESPLPSRHLMTSIEPSIAVENRFTKRSERRVSNRKWHKAMQRIELSSLTGWTISL